MYISTHIYVSIYMPAGGSPGARRRPGILLLLIMIIIIIIIAIIIIGLGGEGLRDNSIPFTT